MWDVWNEPEQSWPHRIPDPAALTCYCPYCRGGFAAWLQDKYSSLDKLNQVWGRCYTSWDQIEAPLDPHVFLDFIDWREYHLDVITAEAGWRLRMVRKLDPLHIPHLHVVPNTMHPFNSVMCADDFALAALETSFAFTMHGGIHGLVQAMSAAGGKPCYNAESHINVGFTNLHQRILTLDDLLTDFLPQIGQGVKGFLFWQHRPESLGWEAPAWGIIRPDGTDRPFTGAIRRFGAVIGPHMEDLRLCDPPRAEIGIWKSRKNELFHYCMNLSMEHLIESVEAYIKALYWSNYRFRLVSDAMLSEGELEGIRLLIMPSCYCLTDGEAKSLDSWVRDGGILLCEAHLGAYNATTGRHSVSVPGCGLAESWGVRETESTSSYHLPTAEGEGYTGAAPQEMKSFLKERGIRGGFSFPLSLEDGSAMTGAYRYAEIKGKGVETLATAGSGAACIVAQSVGRGKVIYSGTNLGQGARFEEEGFTAFLHRTARDAGIANTPISGSAKIRIDFLERDGREVFIVIVNDSAEQAWFEAGDDARWRALFSGDIKTAQKGKGLHIPGGYKDILRREE
jgi:beta-galactosidase